MKKNAPSPAADDPNELPYPGYAREKAAMDLKVASAGKAKATALPGPLREAFAGEPRRLHGFTFQPVNAWLVAILTRIESPLLEVVRIYRGHAREFIEAGEIKDAAERTAALEQVNAAVAAEIEKEIKPSPDAAMETVFAFVTPVEEAQTLLDESRAKFAGAARSRIGTLHPGTVSELERACGEQFTASFTTALSISAKAPEGGGETVFTPPPATPKTASAGGLKS